MEEEFVNRLDLEERKDLEQYQEAGRIAYQIKEYARTIIQKNVLLYDIVEKIESKIIELGGKLAFPVTICINEITAHETPLYEDTKKASGLLKLDFGVHVGGFIADCAFSVDLENSEENKKIILASEKALEISINNIGKNVRIREIGKSIQDTISHFDLNPIRNLCGHSLEKFEIHSGVTIPNYDNENEAILEKGFYAIEPFATSGGGTIYEGGGSGIYLVKNIKPVRDSFSKEIFSFVLKEYKTLPFCSRWLVKKFGKKALISINFLENQGLISQFPKLIEKLKEKVSQAETTIYFDGEKAWDLIKK